MPETIQDKLNLASANDLPAMLRALADADGDGFGTLLQGLIPRRIARSGLTTSATHVEPEAGLISIVEVGTASLVIVGADSTAGAGEVKVTYDTDGVATLVFGDGTTDNYDVTKTVLPDGFGAALAANI